jgi:hypothetical protein
MDILLLYGPAGYICRPIETFRHAVIAEVCRSPAFPSSAPEFRLDLLVGEIWIEIAAPYTLIFKARKAHTAFGGNHIISYHL